MASGQTRKEPIILVASNTLATAGATTTAGFPIPADCEALLLVLDVTAAATDAADTLDVVIQTSIGAAAVKDCCYFTQVLGNGGAKCHVAKIVVPVAETMYSYAALAAGNIKNILGDTINCKYTMVDADGDGSFTFSVSAVPL